MTIIKNNIEYTIKETANAWKIINKQEKITIEYVISKKDASNIDEVKEIFLKGE